MARRDNNGSMDDGNFYQRWTGKRTRMADVLTAAEVGMLEDVVAPLQEEYHGPALGSQHVYPPKRVSRMGGGKDSPDLIEARRLDRMAYWLQREADHARAMALDQAERELKRYHTAPEDIQPTFLPKRQRRALTIRCECGHTGHVILSGRPRPWRLRCSECDELQEL